MPKIGTLTLVPTPIGDDPGTCPLPFLTLPEEYVIAVEELKVARRRWLAWNLPREKIESFLAFNEHTHTQALPDLLSALKAGKDVFLMSDAGLPAFADPGTDLVEACHKKGIPVTAGPFPHAPALAMALSGFPLLQYYYAGFPPREGEERARELRRLGQLPHGVVLMETPYRLKRLLQELAQACPTRWVFVALDLNTPEQRLWRGPLNKTPDFPKARPVVVLAPTQYQGT